MAQGDLCSVERKEEHYTMYKFVCGYVFHVFRKNVILFLALNC